MRWKKRNKADLPSLYALTTRCYLALPGQCPCSLFLPCRSCGHEHYDPTDSKAQKKKFTFKCYEVTYLQTTGYQSIRVIISLIYAEVARLALEKHPRLDLTSVARTL